MSEAWRTDEVARMPQRMAHALHALVAATTVHPPMPRTAAEVCIHDSGWGPLSTGAALREAARRGYCVRTSGGYWVAANRALELRAALEDRYLAETDDGASS